VLCLGVWGGRERVGPRLTGSGRRPGPGQGCIGTVVDLGWTDTPVESCCWCETGFHEYCDRRVSGPVSPHCGKLANSFGTHQPLVTIGASDDVCAGIE
jgi:hypothetical protein